MRRRRINLNLPRNIINLVNIYIQVEKEKNKPEPAKEYNKPSIYIQVEKEKNKPEPVKGSAKPKVAEEEISPNEYFKLRLEVFIKVNENL